MFELRQTSIAGCIEVQPVVRADSRGRFVKVFHDEFFGQRGLKTSFPEQYYSRSHRGVLRGLHFQAPPFAHAKLVYCVEGTVLDAVVDLRVGSPSYGQHFTIELSAERCNQLFVPEGLAHGIYALTELATIVNSTSRVYAPEADGGIAWDSCGIGWPDAAPILSERDRVLPPLSSFVSPFRFDQAQAPQFS